MINAIIYKDASINIMLEGLKIYMKKENELIQAKEMMNAFKNVLVENNEKIFNAFMRHNTSYPFYCKLLEKGYVKELFHVCNLDVDTPEKFKYINYDHQDLKEFLRSDLLEDYAKYLTYIKHEINFQIKEKFRDKYTNNQLNSKQKIKRRLKINY